ncbi:endonuclease [Mycoplasmopsis cynos]|uniref:endonuclease n=1 Tax=Mycoplasmopsis cynos TaxID=171284 RepID=UPI002AFDE6C1|nr:endonuclease [Mycoplasmopsis cynos]WQQ18708.1 endonuclease [Mycoplasmopsis cynos]
MKINLKRSFFALGIACSSTLLPIITFACTIKDTNNQKDALIYNKWENAFELINEDNFGSHFDLIYNNISSKNKNSKLLQKYQDFFSFKGSGELNKDSQNKNYLFKLKDDLKPIDEIEFIEQKNKKIYLKYEYNENTRTLIIKYRVKNINKEFQQKLTIPKNNDNTINKQNKLKNNKQSDVSKIIKKAPINYQYDSSNNYYAELEGKKGQKLFEAIINLQTKNNKKLKTLSYNKLPEFYNKYDAFKDKYYEKDGTLLDIYSENPYGKDPYEYKTYIKGSGTNEGDGTNREHIIPQSWFNKAEPIRHDAHFVWPTDIKVNNIRSNWPHGNVVNPTNTTKNLSKLGRDQNNQVVFEPIDEFKGDIARAYLYFLVTYAKDKINYKNSIYTNAFPYIKKEFLNTYLNWNIQDKVDAWDIHRNNVIFQYQGNRNPFIDYPNLSNSLFGENLVPFHNLGVLKDIT